MRWVRASFRENPFRRRIGTALALAALLMQLGLPAGAAFAFGSDATGEGPLRGAPICTAGGAIADDGAQPHSTHTALHALCPLCQAPAIAWGFVPSTLVLAGPQYSAAVIWPSEGYAGRGDVLAAVRARGPPGAA